jgi:hypothetical protein
MGATSRVISGSIDNLVDFIKSVANKIDGPTDFAEGKGALGNLPYVQLGEPVFEGGRRVVPGSRAEVIVPSGDMNPKLFNAIQGQKRDVDEIIRDIEDIPAQENRSPQMIRQDILDTQNWINDKKDLPGFSDMLHQQLLQIERDKALLRSRTALRGLE